VKTQGNEAGLNSFFLNKQSRQSASRENTRSANIVLYWQLSMKSCVPIYSINAIGIGDVCSIDAVVCAGVVGTIRRRRPTRRPHRSVNYRSFHSTEAPRRPTSATVS